MKICVYDLALSYFIGWRYIFSLAWFIAYCNKYIVYRFKFQKESCYIFEMMFRFIAAFVFFEWFDRRITIDFCEKFYTYVIILFVIFKNNKQ